MTRFFLVKEYWPEFFHLLAYGSICFCLFLYLSIDLVGGSVCLVFRLIFEVVAPGVLSFLPTVFIYMSGSN